MDVPYISAIASQPGNLNDFLSSSYHAEQYWGLPIKMSEAAHYFIYVPGRNHSKFAVVRKIIDTTANFL